MQWKDGRVKSQAAGGEVLNEGQVGAAHDWRGTSGGKWNRGALARKACGEVRVRRARTADKGCRVVSNGAPKQNYRADRSCTHMAGQAAGQAGRSTWHTVYPSIKRHTRCEDGERAH